MNQGRSGATQYQRIGAEAANFASGYELTAMLFDGALERIAQARGAMTHGATAVKGERIGKAISIIEGLRAALDHDAGRELAGNLDELYEYVQARLLHGNLDNDVEALDEAAALIREIKDGWDGIPPAARHGETHPAP